MAISNRLAAERRNTLTVYLCAAIAAATGSAAHADVLPRAQPNAPTQLGPRAPSQPFLRFAPPSLPSAHTRSGNVISVSSCADDGSNGTLRNAIDAANDGDMIDMTGLACSTITLEHGLLLSPVPNLTLKGPGADALTVDGNNGGVVISGNNLDIEALTIAHGVALSGVGGCVLAYGDLSLTDTHVTGCVAVSGSQAAVGGGVAAFGNLAMLRSTISSSKASGTDSAAGGGAAVGGTATLYDSTISGSSVEASQGPVYGGALYAVNAITLHASTIDGNTAYSPAAVAYGGGLDASSDISILDRSAVTNNSAGSYLTWSYGGGIASGTIANPISATVTVSRSVISGNAATSHCGSCFVSGGGVQTVDTIAVDYSTISENKAICGDASSACTGAGGGLFSGGAHATSSITLSNTTISMNEAIGGFIAPGSGVAGGVMANASATVFAHNTTIAFNHASTSGAGIAAKSSPNFPSELISTIVANNDTDVGPSDIGLGFAANSLTIAGSNNLVVAADPNVTVPNDTKTVDPHLQPLTTDDGGATAVHPLASDSIAIDAGANPDSLGCDQRGAPYRRAYGAGIDIGAYEYQGEPHLFSDGFDGVNTFCPFAP